MIDLVSEKTAQDVYKDDFLEDNTENSNATINVFDFLRREGTPLSHSQMNAMMLLSENGLDDIALKIADNRKYTMTKADYDETLGKMTLADRIKGTAKMSHLVKEGMANPAVNISNTHDQAAQSSMNRSNPGM